MAELAEQKERLTERAHLVRLYEAAAKVEFPTPEDIAFRVALSKRIGRDLNLREVRALVIDGAPQTKGGGK